jgi:tetratricopeptide (TPR) repeat protein/CHAT domain-containing protein
MFRSALAGMLILAILSGCQTRSGAGDAYRQSRLHSDQGRYAEAVPYAMKALQLNEAELGTDHPKVAESLNSLAILYKNTGRYVEAESLYQRSLAIRKQAFGPDHPKVATGLNNLGILYDVQGRYDTAETLYKQALIIREKSFGFSHRVVAQSLNNLAILYATQGRYGDAEPLHLRALEIKKKLLGPEHPNLALSLNNLAILYDSEGRYSEAVPMLKRALVIREKALGPNHPDVAQTLNNLANLYESFGRNTEAEPLYKRALAINEKSLGAGHPSVALELNNLAILYSKQGRLAEAQPLYERSVEVREKALGPHHPDVAQSLGNLAILYKNQERFDEAERLQNRVLKIYEKAFGPDHVDVALTLNNLGIVKAGQNQFDEAEAYFKRALAVRRKILRPDHAELAQSLNNLANFYKTQDRYTDADPLFEEALKIWQGAFGPDHPSVALALGNLSDIRSIQGNPEQALGLIRRASTIHRARSTRVTGGRTAGILTEQRSVRSVFVRHVRTAWSVARADQVLSAEMRSEAFEVSQLARATGTARTLAGMGARFAAGSDKLAELVRTRQDGVESWRRLDRNLIRSLSRPVEKRDQETINQLRAELTKLGDKLKDLEVRLGSDFPEYAELTSPEPLALIEAQALLGPGEAMLVYLAADKETFLWVVRKDQAWMLSLDMGRQALTTAVRDLRDGLDPSATGVSSLASIPAFDVAAAFALYQKIFAPAEPLLGGIDHLFVVPDEALQSLPLGVLTSASPKADFSDFSNYRQVPWLAEKFALTTLPSVSSLRALRRFVRAASARKPFGGFGDPLLQGHPGERRGVTLTSLFTARGVADVNAVRSRLAPLPDTADELGAMARILGASTDDLFLRARATENRVKTVDLSTYKVLAFATHGLVAGDLEGLAEPALVLTPPRTGSLADDGLLTASEVATLKLNADMVILSACNTASGDGSPEAEALSGLAKAFFYAGSRSLLVSHWPVGSDAAVNLTTAMLNETTNDKTVGRAESLRRSMLALMKNPGKPHYAHPMFWAPFVVVGEGGLGLKN